MTYFSEYIPIVKWHMIVIIKHTVVAYKNVNMFAFKVKI